MLGALLALASAFAFSVNGILVRRGVAGAGATAGQGAFITVLLGVPFGLIAVVVTGQLFNFGEVPLGGYLLLAVAGIVHFGVGRYCNYRGNAAIGASRAVTIQAVAIPYSIFMAIFLLDEELTTLMFVGIALILGGPAVMIERRSKKPQPPQGAAESATAQVPDAMKVRQLEGYTFSLLAALAYGTSPILIRAAMEDSSRTAAIGTLVAYCAAASVLTAGLALPGQRQLISAINLRYMRLFGGAGPVGLPCATAAVLCAFHSGRGSRQSADADGGHVHPHPHLPGQPLAGEDHVAGRAGRADLVRGVGAAGLRSRDQVMRQACASSSAASYSARVLRLVSVSGSSTGTSRRSPLCRETTSRKP